MKVRFVEREMCRWFLQLPGENSQPHWGLFMQRGGRERWEVQFWEAVFQARKSKVQHQLVGMPEQKTNPGHFSPDREIRQEKISPP